MMLFAFKHDERPDEFNPICEEGHQLDGFDCHKDVTDVILIDRKGWACEVGGDGSGDDVIKLDGAFAVETECEMCLDKGFPRVVYQWVLYFTCGILRRVQQLPVSRPGIATAALVAVQPALPSLLP